jgi:DNA-binding CsgD family transcriptional regulator
LHDDVNKFSWLARSATSVGGLMQATQRNMEQSPRYREVLAPLALGDELRAALITSGACWGFLCLHRERSSPQFTPAEIAFIGRLTPHIAEGLRKALLLGNATGSKALNEPGLLLLAEDLSVVAITPIAERWLSEIEEVDWSRKLALPSAICAVVARLQEIERNNEVYSALLPKVRLRTASGHWLVLHASRLAGPSAQAQIAVIFEAARPAEIAPLIVQAYDLSKRESEIMQSVSQGLSTAEMSATFQISSNTVQDHLKAIFEKVGVHSRRELVGQLFAQQYQPRLVSGRDLDANGWFTETAISMER